MSQLIRKNWRKGLSGRLANTFITGVGTVGFIAASKKLESFAPKVHGPGAMLLGGLISAFTENDQLQALGTGIASAGMLISSKQFLPEDIKQTLGLNGLGSVDEEWSPGVGAVEDINYDTPRMLEEPMGELEPTYVDDVNASQIIRAGVAGVSDNAINFTNMM